MDEDCPPGAEGYEDTVTEKANKKPIEDACTKAEHEFQEHLNSLKIKLENGSTKPMVERRGRDLSGKWIYLCFPCGAMCSGESVLQTHISGKKHKTKLALRNVWPNSIFDEHPYVMAEKGNTNKGGSAATEKVLQKMAEEVDLHNTPANDLDRKYDKYREVRCHIQDTIDVVKAPLLGIEYLVEHPPEQSHYEPSYICVLCSKQGHPRTIMNHMTCFWHRYNYLVRHFTKASTLLAPFRGQSKFREGVYVIMNRLAQRIEDKYGRLKPVNIDKEEYEKDRELIHQWLFKSKHFTEQMGPTFEEVVDVDLINSLHQSNEGSSSKSGKGSKGRDPSPPVVAAPTKPNYRRHPSDRRDSEEVMEINEHPRPPFRLRDERARARHETRGDVRFRPYEGRREDEPLRSRYAIRNIPEKTKAADKDKDKTRPPNYEYKLKLAEDRRKAAEDSAKKTLAYHEKNPEKHPLYPEEWKKFWNRRYKEIQAEGKDPSKHDFKPEWIVFWTTRMKELHDEELRVNIIEIFRKLCLTPPDMSRRSASKRRSVEPRRRSPEMRRRSPSPRRRSPSPRRRSPSPRRRSPELRRRSPELRRRSPELRRRSPELRRRSPERRRSPPPDFRRERRTPPEFRRHSPPPMRHLRTRSRSPIRRSRSPVRSHGTHIMLDSLRRSRSPLSRRGEASRNRSPAPPAHQGPASQTVMISDDELKPDDNLSPWNSDNDIDSLGSLPDAKSPPPRSHTGSVVSSRASRPRQFPREYSCGTDPQDLGPAENVVATLRLLVALEDYLGSLGPKVVDLMTEALKMEKDKPNSSEELLERESAVVLMETAKEKLKGAMQAGLVPLAAHPALRNAVVRAAATLHAADMRAKKKQPPASKSASSAPAVSVAGVGSVDRAQIAQQMAAALIAQGKTDVSSEELAQLVDAVVGMAEAKKREAEVKKKQEARAFADKASRPAPSPAAKPTASASALQMLQSAYDENDKRAEKEDAPDAMDGLSDSDLETLLKNFNELSAEEQHSLIAYLKKLEAREPQRVERLRQYVSAAATAAPGPAKKEPLVGGAAPVADPPAPPAAPAARADHQPVTIDSDDDDYTVEEVFKSVNQKVKEDQIRQEMEIVKKSLEETKAAPVEATASVDLTKNMSSSSAAGLLALVQASIQSSSASAPPPARPAVVASSAQPRSFGDRPAPAARPAPPAPAPAASPPGQPNQGHRPNQNNFAEPNQGNFGGQNQNFGGQNQGSFGGNSSNFGGQNPNNFGGQKPNNFGGQNQSFGGNQDEFDQGDFGGPSKGNFGGPNQGNFGGPIQDNFGGPNQANFGGPIQDNFGGPNQDNFGGPNQGNFGGPNQANFGGPIQDNFGGPNQDNFGGPNQGNFGGPNQGNFGGPIQDNFGGPNQDNFGGPNQGNFGGPNQDNFGGPNQGNFGGPNQGNFGGPNQGNFGGNRNFPNQQQISPWEKDNNMNDNMMDNRGGLLRPPVFDNQGQRGNFMNGRMQDNYDKRPQPFGNQGNNYQGNNFQGNNNFQGQGNNFRGRGGGRGRGRGRGGGYH